MGPAFLTPVNNVRKPAGPVPLLPQPMGTRGAACGIGSCLPYPRRICPAACGTCLPATTVYGEQHVGPVFPTPVNYTLHVRQPVGPVLLLPHSVWEAACGSCLPYTHVDYVRQPVGPVPLLPQSNCSAANHSGHTYIRHLTSRSTI